MGKDTEYSQSIIQATRSYLAPIRSSSQSELEEGWNLSQFLGIVRRRGILMGGIALVITSVFWVKALRQKPIYRENFQLLVEPVTASNQDTISNFSARSRGSQIEILDYLTQIQVLQSSRVLQPIVLKIQQRYPEFSYGELVGSLTIDREKLSKIIDVTYQNEDAFKVALVLEEVANGFLQYSKEEQKTSLRQGLKFVEKQVETTRERVDLLQRDLEFFRRKNNFIDATTENQKISSQILSLESKGLALREEIAETDKAYENLKTPTGIAAILANDEGYQSLINDLQEVDKQIANESTRFRSDTLFIQALREQRQNFLPVLRQEAKRILTNELARIDSKLSLLEERQQTLELAESYWREEEQRLPIKTRLHTDIQRELGVATESLNRFLQVRENLQVKASQQEIPWQLIDPPRQPTAPLVSTQRNLVLGLISGLIAGVTAGWLAEKFDNTFHSVEEFRKESDITLLAAIPFYQDADQYQPSLAEDKSESVALLSPRHLRFREAFHSLYANVCHLEQGHRIHSIAVSSPQRGEGKTVIATHLAQSAAAMGKKVLLIDADFRHRALSRRLNRAQGPGFSELLTTSIDPKKVILDWSSPIETVDDSAVNQPSRKQNLFFLSSGHALQDPASLLASLKMGQLSIYFAENFDLVIYDTPSLLDVADSMLVAKQAKKMILVSAIAQTEKNVLLESLERLQISNIPVLGLVVNGVRIRNFLK